MEVRQKVQSAYHDDIQNRMTGRGWSAGGGQSWYIHPLSGKNVSQWRGFIWPFREKARRFVAEAHRLDRESTTIDTMNEVTA